MSDDAGLFRKSALDKLASPERLDVLMEVTPPQDRVAKLTILALLAAGLGYGFFGNTPERVPGTGQVQGAGGILKVVVAGEGTLEQFNLKELDRVESGQLLAVIRSLGVEQNVEGQRAEVMALEQTANEVRIREGGEVARLESRRAELNGQLTLYEADRERIDKLVKSKDLPQNQLTAVDAKINQTKSELSSINQQVQQSNQRVRDAESRANVARINFEKTSNTTTASSELRSTASGFVSRVLKTRGDRVGRGDTLAEIEMDSTTEALKVLAYVPAASGRKVVKGQAVQVTVAGIKREEYGFLKGTVDRVGDIIVSAKDASAKVSNTIGGPSYEVEVTLVPDNTASGYAWSTGKGPPQKLVGNTAATIAVEVGSRTPISQFIPYIRGMFGF